MHTWYGCVHNNGCNSCSNVSKVLHDITKFTSNGPTCLAIQCKDLHVLIN